ncbi:MAG: VWA domain-containing protein [Acidobacteria bacterium]|nr:MAG: VWA domain-containing protein [Acidobacteriota bacterium]REK07928.1 MAG: VWA domain-containing protein [Acidobacteriota bacterium]
MNSETRNRRLASITSAPALLCLVLLSAGPHGAPAGAQPAAQDVPAAQGELYAETVNVEVINIDVYVRDGDGNPVQGLEADDFELFVDGKRSTISNFYAVSGEATTTEVVKQAALPEELPVGEGPGVEVRPLDQRLHVVVYIDNFNLTPFSRNKVLRELRIFLREQLSEDDEVMLVTYDRALNMRHPFTNRPENVSRALLEIEDISAQRIHQNSDRYDAMREIEDADSFYNAFVTAEEYAKKVRNDTEFTIQALRSLVDNLAGSAGRKALIYVGDGLPMIAAEEAFWGVQMVFPDQMSMIRVAEYDFSSDYQQLAAQANANRVSFYTIDARGLSVLSQGQVDYDIAGAAGERARLDQITNSNMQAPFQLLAEKTGGRAILNTNRFLPDLERIGTDFRAYYSLGYLSPTPGDGRYHAVEVRLKDPQRGWTVRHREGYRDKTVESRMHDGTLSALHLSLGENDLDAKLVFGPQTLRADGLYDVPFRLVVPWEKIVLIPQQGVHRGSLRVWLAAKDEDDKLSDVQQVPLDIAFPSDQIDRTEGTEYVQTLSLTMEPGYQDVAVGVRDLLGGSKAFIRQGVFVGRRTSGP